MSKKLRIVMVPSVIPPEGRDVTFLCGVRRGMFLIVTQSDKSTFLDGGFSVFVGNTRVTREIDVQKQRIESRGERVRLVTANGALTLTRDKHRGGYRGTFRGKRVRVLQSPA